MDGSGQFLLVRPTEALATRALRVLMGGPEVEPNVPAFGRAAEVGEKAEGFLAYARSVGLDITRQTVVLVSVDGAEPIIVTQCLWVPSAGRTAMLFVPSQSEYPTTATATTAAVVAAMEDARGAGVMMIQAMLEPADGAGKTVFAAAGLTQLATLTYMERKPTAQVVPMELPPGFALEAYSAATHPLFAEAILASYEQTLDCPGLSGMRDVEDIIVGHKAVGPFDPELWSVLLRYGKPVGCLLLGEIPARRALELVYLGLAVAARGQGLGRILMQRVLMVASRRQFEVATLAVDAANIPATRLYRRCGFTSVAQRVAMVRRVG
jgi:ribosomal protein S18 acetylase RimI-like enzyme